MFKNGNEAVTWIDSRVKHGTRPGLLRINELLRLLGNPENQVKSIHIAGTNGKGSTVMYLQSLLEEKHLNVGTFTSPYIESFYERIAINGQMISEDDFCDLANKFLPLVEKLDQDEKFYGISQFEILTGMAFDYFKDRVDIAIIETGIGGLLDSTNVVHPELTAITTVGMDHVDILGDTVTKIAAQKAGIIKEGIPIVVGNVSSAPLEVIQKEANSKNAPLYAWKKEYVTNYQGFSDHLEKFTFQNGHIQIPNLQTPLTGHQQVENVAVALELFYLYCQKHGFSFDETEIKKGLLKVRWPARMELISSKPMIIMDGAHNPHAIKRLKDNILTEYQNYRIHLLFSAITTKNIDLMLQDLLTIPNVQIVLTTFDHPDAVDLAEYHNFGDQLELVPDWKDALSRMTERLDDDDVLFITGSLYFVSEVRDRLLNGVETV